MTDNEKTCENCSMFTHCRYDLERHGEPCEHFKVNTVRENIISKINYYKDCWQALTEKDSFYLKGKIEAMDMAIKIVNAEFDKKEGENGGQ